MQSPPASAELTFSVPELSHFLYGTQKEFEAFLSSTKLKQKLDSLKFRPENYCHEPNQHLAEEGRVLLELIQAHKSNSINLKTLLPYLKDLTAYSRVFETHFQLFRNLAMAFSTPKTASVITSLIDNMSLIGSVLLEEFDFNRSYVDDNVETIATFHPESGTFKLST